VVIRLSYTSVAVADPDAEPVFVTSRVYVTDPPGVVDVGLAVFLMVKLGDAVTQTVALCDAPPVTVAVLTTGNWPGWHPPPPELPVKVVGIVAWYWNCCDPPPAANVPVVQVNVWVVVLFVHPAGSGSRIVTRLS